MYYVVDTSNPKEPMEFIRVTRQDMLELREHFKKNGLNTFYGNFDNCTPLYKYVTSNEKLPYYYDTNPLKVGTIFTYVQNMYKFSKYDKYLIDFSNDIDFIFLFVKVQEESSRFSFFNGNIFDSHDYLIRASVSNFLKKISHYTSFDKAEILTKLVANPLTNKNLIENKYQLVNDFFKVKKTDLYFFKKMMIHSLKTIINILTSTNQKSIFTKPETIQLFTEYYKILLDWSSCVNFEKQYMLDYNILLDDYMELSYILNENTESMLDEKDVLPKILKHFNNLYSVYNSSLYICDDMQDMTSCDAVIFMVDLHMIITTYSLLTITITDSSLSQIFSDTKNLTLDSYFDGVEYIEHSYDNYINRTNKYLTHFTHSLQFIRHLLLIIENPTLDTTNPAKCSHRFLKYTENIYIESLYYIEKSLPLEYIFLVDLFKKLVPNIITVSSRKKHNNSLSTPKINVNSIVSNVISNFCKYNYFELINSDSGFHHLISANDYRYFLSLIMHKRSSDNKCDFLYSSFNRIELSELFRLAIEGYILFSKYPIDKCSHCGAYFLKTSPNRKFCDSSIKLLKSNMTCMTCKEERQKQTEKKIVYQETSNDFSRYLQKIKLKGNKIYTKRVYKILETNRYFDIEKPKELDKLSKTDKKDLLWLLNSFFNYSYAINESMKFQSIIKDASFKDVRYYNNAANDSTYPITPEEYKTLFEQFKAFTRTNKENEGTIITNVYDSLFEYLTHKDSTLNFQKIGNGYMEELNNNDINKLINITQSIIHIFFLQLSNWYIKDTGEDIPTFTYNYPEKYSTFKLKNINYISDTEIKGLEDNINRVMDSISFDKYIKEYIHINEIREQKVMDLVAELGDKLKERNRSKEKNRSGEKDIGKEL